jgi:tRNA 2-thiouridine synthesizing protein A
MSEFKVADNRIQATAILDVRGLNCPIPLFRTKKEITNLSSGDILQIDGTDPGSRRDFPGWCDRSGHKYLGEKEMFDYISFFIRKG